MLFKTDSEYDRKRQEANREIIKKISEIVEKYPQQRFIQILFGLNIIRQKKDGEILDKFYEEPWITLMLMEGKNEK